MKEVFSRALQKKDCRKGRERCQGIDARGMGDFGRTLSDLLGELPGMRRELHEKLAEIAKKEVDAAISSSGLNDSGQRYTALAG